MSRIRIVRAKPRFIAEGKRFQAVLEADSGRVIGRAPPTRTRQRSVSAARSVVYTAFATGALEPGGSGADPIRSGSTGGGRSPYNVPLITP